MTQKKQQRADALIEKKVVDLHNEGWHIPNIASISMVDAGTVREILKRRNLIQM